jgi:hypothetical protein
MILSYEVVNGMLRVTTDNPGRSEFVYESDRFSTLQELELEIDKSIAAEEVSKVKKELKSSFIKSELKSLGAVEKVKE